MREVAIRFLEALVTWFEYRDAVPEEHFNATYYGKVVDATAADLVNSSLADMPAGELGVAVFDVRAIAMKWANLEAVDDYVDREQIDKLLKQVFRHSETTAPLPVLSGVITVDGRRFVSRSRILDTHDVTSQTINGWYERGFPRDEHKRGRTLYYDLEKVNRWFESAGMLKIIV